jgi:hypothetical protein
MAMRYKIVYMTPRIHTKAKIRASAMGKSLVEYMRDLVMADVRDARNDAAEGEISDD